MNQRRYGHRPPPPPVRGKTHTTFDLVQVALLNGRTLVTVLYTWKTGVWPFRREHHHRSRYSTDQQDDTRWHQGVVWQNVDDGEPARPHVNRMLNDALARYHASR